MSGRHFLADGNELSISFNYFNISQEGSWGTGSRVYVLGRLQDCPWADGGLDSLGMRMLRLLPEGTSAAKVCLLWEQLAKW